MFEKDGKFSIYMDQAHCHIYTPCFLYEAAQLAAGGHVYAAY